MPSSHSTKLHPQLSLYSISATLAASALEPFCTQEPSSWYRVGEKLSTSKHPLPHLVQSHIASQHRKLHFANPMENISLTYSQDVRDDSNAPEEKNETKTRIKPLAVAVWMFADTTKVLLSAPRPRGKVFQEKARKHLPEPVSCLCLDQSHIQGLVYSITASPICPKIFLDIPCLQSH